MEQTPTNLEPVTPPESHNESQGNMESLLAQEGEYSLPKAGEVRKGTIASITPGQILVSVGSKSEGVIAGREFELIPQEQLAELKIGQEIPVYVINPEDHNGNVVLSFVRAKEESEWKLAEDLITSKAPFHSKIIGYNKGGLIVPLGAMRGFIPTSQISLSRRAGMSGETTDQKWAKFIGEEIDVCVIEVDRERQRLILSERMASTETRDEIRQKVMDELKEGEVRTGRVTGLADFGAFVNIGGADGLVHVTEISWDHIDKPADKLKVGQDVKVKVINIDREKKRIGLSIRLTEKDPWADKVAQYHIGQLVEGKITRLTKFGAFAKLEEDVEGLIHISEISERRIEHPKEALHEGDTVTLRVIKIDPESHRIGLSVRKVESLAYADEDWRTLENMVGGGAPAAAEAPILLQAEVPAAEKPVAEKKHKKEPKPEAVAETPAETPIELPAETPAEAPAEEPVAEKKHKKEPKPEVAEAPAEKVIELPASVEEAKPDAAEPNMESPTPDEPSAEAKPE